MKLARDNRVARQRGGFGLVEILISASIALLALGTIGLATSSNVNAFEAGNLRAGLIAKASQALERVVREVESADEASLTGVAAWPGVAVSTTFDVPATLTLSTGALTWSTHRLELVFEPGEVDDGADNDGDGMVDEGQLVYTRAFGTPQAMPIVLATGVAEFAAGETFDGTDENGNGAIDERGLALSFDGTRLRIELCLERPDGKGGVVRATISTSATCRN